MSAKPINMLGVIRKAKGRTLRDAAKQCRVATSTIMRAGGGPARKLLRAYGFAGYADELERLLKLP